MKTISSASRTRIYPTHFSTALRSLHSFAVQGANTAGNRGRSLRPCLLTSVQPMIACRVYKQIRHCCRSLPSKTLSLTSQTDADPPDRTGYGRRIGERQTRTIRNLSLTLHPLHNHKVRPSTTGCHRFPLNNFKYFLTLFSKFFSSFPHGTCSLSVSR